MLRITKLAVPRFRQLVDIKPLTLGKPTVIVGPNGVGKSTMMRALVFLLSGTLDDQDRAAGELEVHGAFVGSDKNETILRRILDKDGKVRLEQKCAVPEVMGLRGLDAMNAGQLREAIETHLPSYNGDKRSIAPMREALEGYAARMPQVEGWAANEGLKDLLPVDILFASTEVPDPEEEVRRSLDATFKAFRSANDFRERLQRLEEEFNTHLEEAGDSIRETLKRRCSDLGEPSLTAEVAIANSFRGVSLTVGDESSRRPLNALGAGERRRITLAVWEATADAFQAMDLATGPVRQRVVIYDEPDTHLDYFRQRELMRLLLDQASGPNDCVVVATHSQNLVDGVDPDSIIALRKNSSGESNAVIFLGGSIEDHIGEIATSLGINNSSLLNERCFVIVEGKSEAYAFPILYRSWRGRRHEADGIFFIDVNGNGSALKVAALLKDLGRTIVVLVDRDCVTHESTKKFFGPDSLKKHGLHEDLMLLGSKGDQPVEEFEGLFSDLIWASALNSASPRSDGEWGASEIAALRAENKFSGALVKSVHDLSGEGASKPALARAVAQQSVDEGVVPDELAASFEAVLERINVSKAESGSDEFEV